LGESNAQKKAILLIEAAGQLGKLIGSRLQGEDSVTLRVASRKKAQIPEPSNIYDEALLLDLDDPQTFAEALKGINRLFLLTGYSVSMVVQSKTLIDAAKTAGVEHIVHLGVFSLAWDCTVPHFNFLRIKERTRKR